MNRLKKIGAVVAIIILNILVFGIIPLNVLLIWKDFPQWIMIPTSVVDIAVVMLIAKKVFSGKAAKIIAVVITSVFAGLCVLLAYACPYWNSDVFKSDRPIHYYENSDLTKKEALDKLEEVMDCLSLLLGQQAFYNGYCFLSHEVLIQRLNDGIHAGIVEVFNL